MQSFFVAQLVFAIKSVWSVVAPCWIRGGSAVASVVVSVVAFVVASVCSLRGGSLRGGSVSLRDTLETLSDAEMPLNTFN